MNTKTNTTNLFWSKLFLAICMTIDVICILHFFSTGNSVSGWCSLLLMVGIVLYLNPWKKKTPKEAGKETTNTKEPETKKISHVRTAQDLEEYKRSCVNLAKESANAFVFRCIAIDLVSIAVSTLFEHSNKVVKIYAKDMYGELFDNPAFFEAFKSYVDSGKPLQILLDSIVPENAESKSLCLWYLQKNHVGNPHIVIRGATNEFKKAMNAHLKQSPDKEKPSYCIQMIIGDSRMFKFDAMIEGEREGFCDFQGAVKRYRFFEETFDSHFPTCVPLPLK